MVDEARVAVEVKRRRLGRIVITVEISGVRGNSRVVAGVNRRRARLQAQIVILRADDIVRPVGIYKQRIGVDVANAGKTSLHVAERYRTRLQNQIACNLIRAIPP